MVKKQSKAITKDRAIKSIPEGSATPRKITASTLYGTCTERLNPFGGLLGLIKFLDLLRFEELFDYVYREPGRTPKLGHYRMVVEILMLLFIGFNRLWHFVYIRLDAMVCDFFQLPRLPAASTFWRYKAYRPVLCFVDEIREYLLGKLRKGDVLNGEECAVFIGQIKDHLPGCVKKVLLRADGEFFSWESVLAATEVGFQFIIANKRAKAPFDPGTWYQPRRRNPIQYNSCVYQPLGWEFPCRFVAMRIPKEQSSTPSQPL